jgi:hypothetical protein
LLVFHSTNQVSHWAAAKEVAVVAGRNLQSAIHAQVCTSKQLGLRSGHWRMQIGEGRGRHELNREMITIYKVVKFKYKNIVKNNIKNSLPAAGIVAAPNSKESGQR